MRRQKPRHKCHANGREWYGTIRNQASIDDRLKLVDQSARIGDWESDTLIAKHHQRVLVTLAERKSRDSLAGRLPVRHAEGATERINNLPPPHQHKYHTVTFGNGKEFAIGFTLDSSIEIYLATDGIQC